MLRSTSFALGPDSNDVPDSRIGSTESMSIADLVFRRPKPTRVAAVYTSRERALEAAAAAKGEGLADDDHVHLVGPLEEMLGNKPPPRTRGSWAVVVEPDTYPQSKRIVRALRHPFGRRAGDRTRASVSAASKSTNPAVAGLVANRR
jgi:hypothetical protein